ncbi:energy transducer TonB [Sphingobium estronivorans]|uniref:energy transducer TonB n=1 Tax=Sphingobium estronivorans TaxID=1577690 RepID=UPI00123BB9F6|nr:energy transducer TonB [Sphingobium estronivorans]
MIPLWAQRWRGSNRIAPAVAALLVNALIGYGLMIGLRASPLLQAVADNPLALFDLKPPEKDRPAPPKPEKTEQSRSEGGGLPHSRPRDVEKSAISPPSPAIAAPAPIIAVPAPVAAAPLPAGGPAVSGDGDGNGSNGSGSGTGSGAGQGEGDGGKFSRARQTGGRFRNSDFPDWLRGVGSVKIGVRYAIGPSGHVDRCEIIENSGYPEVDAMTCRIIIDRYRFRPAKDPDGYAVTEVREEDYRWRVR